MPRKPTYKELERRVKELEEETVKLKLAEEQLQTAVARAEEEKLEPEAIIESMGDAISILGTDFRFLSVVSG